MCSGTARLRALLGDVASSPLIIPRPPSQLVWPWRSLVCLFLIVMFLIVRFGLSVDRPGALQHVFELVVGFIEQQSHEIIGPHSEAHTPFLVSLALFILFCNLIGLVPGFESPTAVPIVPLGCALVAFFYYQAQGFRHSGIKYLAHFAGPMPALAPLMIPIELISHLARVLSLTIRLFANMFAGDMVTLVFFSLVPLGIPILFSGTASGRLIPASVHFRVADHGLSGRSGRGRTLGTSVSSFKFLVSRTKTKYECSKPGT